MTNEEQSTATKSKLSTALKSLLYKKELTKITVSELIEICDINRNTFYYHFDNVYDLFEWTVENDVFDTIKKMEDSVSPEDILNFMIDYCEKNRQIFEWAYEFMDYRTRYKCFGDKLYKLIYQNMENELKSMQLKVNEKDMNFFCSFFTDSLVSSFYRYIKGETGYTRKQYTDMLISTVLTSLKQFIMEKGLPYK